MIKLVEEKDDTPESDPRAFLAALINENKEKNRPSNTDMLENLSKSFLKITDDLVDTRNKYMRLHNLTEGKDEGVSYDINAVQQGITYAIHECHKVMALFEKELREAQQQS